MPEKQADNPAASSQTPTTQNPANGAAPAGGASTTWLSTLPEDLRSNALLNRYKDVAALAKGHIEAEKVISSRVGLRVPGPDATPEERSEFYTKLGRPESADKYDIKFEGDAPVDEALLTSFRGKAFDLGLTAAQAQELGRWYAEQAGGANGNLQSTFEQEEAAWDNELRSEWAWAYDRNCALAARGLANLILRTEGENTNLAEHPLVKVFDETGLGNHPAVLKFFNSFAKKMGEDAFIDGDAGPSEEDRKGAVDKKNEIFRADHKTHPYWNDRLAGHKEAVEEVRRLNEIIHAPKEQ